MDAQAQRLSRPATLYAVKRFSEAISELKGGIQPQLPLELALIEAIGGAVTSGQPVVQQVAAAPVAVPAVIAPPMVAPPTVSPATSASVDRPVPQATPAIPAPAEESPPPLDQAAVQKLHSRWSEFLNVVKAKSGFKQEAALRSVRDIAIGDNAVAFAFGNNKFAREMVSSAETLAQVAEILSQFLGRQVSLTCQTGETAVLSAAAGRVVRDAVDHDGPDPLVEYAVSELGAKVIE